MKNFRHILIALFAIVSLTGYAQVQVDKAIQLTGSGANAKVSGIQSVSANQDAVNVDAVQKNSLTFASAGGGTNAYTVTLAPAITAYSSGMIVGFISNGANTGATTLNVNGQGAKTIKKNFSSDLISGDIRNGQAVIVMYDGTNFQMLSQSGNGSGTSLAHGKQVFYFQGGPQYFTVPDGVTSLDVKLWGAAGGSMGTPAYGGGGAFVHGTLTVTPNTAIAIIVGQGGCGGCLASGLGGVATRTYGGGGGSWTGNSGAGGGRSAIQVSGNDVVTAGGGGGGAASDAGTYGNGGGGGAATGDAGQGSSTFGPSDGGGGGTIAAGGAGGVDGSAGGYDGNDGSLYTGGDPSFNFTATYGGGGGGGGYYGGAGGAGGNGSGGGGGGGGGSSYVTAAGFTLILNQPGATTPNGTDAQATAGGSGDPDYQQGIGATSVTDLESQNTQSGNGLVIITW